MNIVDLIIRIKRRVRDIICHYLRKPFIGSIGKGSYLKSGTRIVGNPYRIRIGKKSKIWHNVVLSVGNGQIVIGNGCTISVGSFFNATEGKILIGNSVGIAAHCNIFSYSISFSDADSWKESYIVGDVVIEDNVVIGAGAVILPGVTIGKGAIISAGSIVNKNVKPYTWYLKDGTQWHPER